MKRAMGVLVIGAACACGDPDGTLPRDDGGLLSGDGGSGADAAACTSQVIAIGDGTGAACSFAVELSFDPGLINIALQSASTRDVVCHTLRETGCTGDGWYWSSSTHEIVLCDETCAALQSAGTGTQVVMETGCATAPCSGAACTQSTGYCTHSTAASCCSGRCDGDSCGSGLWGPCPGMFGCFEGTCQAGYCQCAPGDMQCGASCFDPMSSSANCGACGNACSGGKTCEAGSCECPAGSTDCTGTCVTLDADPANCGICGRTCRADQLCSGACVCGPQQLDCNGACVAATSPMHCGACNNICDTATETCTANGSGGASCACNAGLFDCGGNGTCEDRMTDEMNCGTCGRVCPGNKTCIAGDC